LVQVRARVLAEESLANRYAVDVGFREKAASWWSSRGSPEKNDEDLR